METEVKCLGNPLRELIQSRLLVQRTSAQEGLSNIFIRNFQVFHDISMATFCNFQVIYPLQAIGIALIVLLNLFMLRSFNAALQSSPTTLQASLLTTAANLVITVRK